MGIISVAMLAAGCATPYQRYGARGGYYDFSMGRDLALVSFQGNSYTSTERISASLLYRCAEVTEARGYGFFIIRARPVQSASSASGTAPPAGTADNAAYRKQAIIEMFKRKEDNGKAYDARQTLEYLGPQLGLVSFGRHRGFNSTGWGCARSSWADSASH